MQDTTDGSFSLRCMGAFSFRAGRAIRALARFAEGTAASAVLFAAAPLCGQQIVTLASGGTVTLAVTAEGTAPFTYEWRRDGVVLAGVTGDRYVIGTFMASDAGAYTVVVSNSAGSTTTDAATLTCEAETAPGFTLQPVSQNVSEGADVTLTAAATGNPSPSFRWRRDGIELVDGAAISGAGSATLKLSGVTPGDSGRYSVVATNAMGTALSGEAVLTVEALDSAPIFTLQPVSRTVKEGSGVSFTAEATAKPAPAYRWHRDGVALNDGVGVSGVTTSKLELSSARSTDVGLYTLVAKNSVGEATSSGAALTISTTTIQKGSGKGGTKTSPDSGGTSGTLDGLNLFENSVPAGFDAAGYLLRYPKYKQKLGTDPLKAWLYYRDTGVLAGEVYDDLFRPEEYLALNPDVLATYGADLRAALLHWLNYGLSEGRQGRY